MRPYSREGIALKRITKLFEYLSDWETFFEPTDAVNDLYEAAASLDEDIARELYDKYLNTVSEHKYHFHRDRQFYISAIETIIEEFFFGLLIYSETDIRVLRHLAMFYSYIGDDKYFSMIKSPPPSYKVYK